MNELVSIVITTYKTNESLDKAIKSVLDQTYPYIEVIIVDDNNSGSEGNRKAQEIVGRYSSNKIKYIEHGTNRNASAARNTGFLQSKGYYIGFLDDDDYYYPNKVEEQVRFINETNADFCTCFYKMESHIITFREPDKWVEDILMLRRAPQTSSFLMKAQLYRDLEGFDSSFVRHQDYEFVLRVVQSCKAVVLNKVLYERTNNGIINIPSAYKMETVKAQLLNKYMGLIESHNLNYSLIEGTNYGYVAFLYIKEHNYKAAWKLLIKRKSLFGFYYLIKRLFIGLFHKINRLIPTI